MTTTTPEYTRVNITEAQAGDEILQAGEWHAIASVGLTSSRTSAVVRFPSGSSMSFPVSHNPQVRRQVLEAEGYEITVGGREYQVDASDYCAQLDAWIARTPAGQLVTIPNN